MFPSVFKNTPLYNLLYVSLIIDYILSPISWLLSTTIKIIFIPIIKIIQYILPYIINFTLHFLPYTLSISISIAYLITNFTKLTDIVRITLICIFDITNIIATSFVYYRYYQLISKPVIIEAKFNSFRIIYSRVYLLNKLSIFAHIFTSMEKYGITLFLMSILSSIIWAVVYSVYNSIFIQNDKYDLKKYIIKYDDTNDYELSNIEIVVINNHVCEENCNICPCSICLDNFQDSNNVIQLKCKHMFHKDCIKNYIRSTSINNLCKCPYCRQYISI